ncbi:DUF3578 domain-containing protein [Agrococcus sp. HG114]|nr:DUF3578 domain-containing protein [Agrococcus sp. HG114]
MLELQSDYSFQITEEMAERGAALNEIGAALREALQGGHPELKVLQSNGAGNAAKVPWVNIADPQRSTSPTDGYYLVYLFSRDGSAVYLSLDLGVTRLDRSDAVEMVRAARRLLPNAALADTTAQPTEAMDLADNNLGRKYELGNIEAIRYDADDLPADDALLADLEAMIARMQQLPPRLGELAGVAGADELRIEYVPSQASRAASLARELTWPVERAEEALDVLASERPQIALYGPPGTGKSFVAKRIAAASIGSADAHRTRFVQFHSSYGYEEFVEGLRPTATAKSTLEFVRTPGVLLRLAQEINADGLTRALIIDEMNRANLPRVFGELLYLLEYRDDVVNLMHEESFRLPRELQFIGTMNTADRSAQGLDVALRRRFEFFELLPDVEVLREHYRRGSVNALGERLYEGFEELNRRLRAELASNDLLIGHSYFMKPRMDEKVLGQLFRRQLMPLLEDYFFMDRSRLADFELNEMFNVHA